MDHGPAGLPSHVSWFRGGTKNLQYHPNEVSFSLPWRPGAPAPAAPWSFFSPRGLLQAFSRYRFRLALLLRFKNTGGAGTHRTPVKRHRGEPGLTGSNSAVAPVVASVVLTFTRYTRSAVLIVGSFDWRNARVWRVHAICLPNWCFWFTSVREHYERWTAYTNVLFDWLAPL